MVIRWEGAPLWLTVRVVYTPFRFPQVKATGQRLQFNNMLRKLHFIVRTLRNLKQIRHLNTD